MNAAGQILILLQSHASFISKYLNYIKLKISSDLINKPREKEREQPTNNR